MDNTTRDGAGGNADFLAVADPLLHFETRGVAIGRQIGIAPETVREAIDILKGAFGADELTQMAQKKNKVDIVPVPKNRLGDMINVAGPHQICEVCELALYLKTLARVQGITPVINGIRNPTDYDTSLMQLAYAYRFHRIGAESIELEPAVLNGRVGDIAFTLAGINYVVECYVNQSLPLHSKGMEFELRPVLSKMVDALSDRDDLIYSVLLVRPKRAVAASERKQILACTRKLVNEIEPASDAKYEDDLVTLEIRRSSFEELKKFVGWPDEKDWPEYARGACVYVKGQFQSAAELEAFQKIGQPMQEAAIRNMVFVWEAEDAEKPTETALDDWVDDITPKISAKLAQTRRNGARRLMIVASEMASMEGRTVNNAIFAIGERLKASHDNYAGTFFITRATWHNYRQGFVGHVLGGNEAHQLPDWAIDALLLLEAHKDILTA